MTTFVGQVIKGYEFLEQVGTGGYAVVYRAFQPVVGRQVAIKVILPVYTQNPEFVRRFEAEARLIARLEHPHIVPLYDYWCEGDGAYLVMRWLPNTLRRALAEGPLPVEGAARLLDQLANALSVAHRHQIIHRDIKPDNILLDDDDNAYLADFGIAKDLSRPGSTQERHVPGTLAYVTPEQLGGQRVTPQTDQYSLGLVLYETLTGELPFGPVSASALIHKQLHEPLPQLHERRPDLPPALDAVLQKAMDKDPAGRYPDVLRFADAVRAAVAVPLPRRYQPLPDPLTDRELEILRLMVGDKSNAEIAQQLFLSPRTVK